MSVKMDHAGIRIWSSSHPPCNWLDLTSIKIYFLGLGISACSYYGRIQQKCQLIPVIAENLPSECTSFVYDGLKVNLAHEITDANNAEVESM